MSKIEIPSWFTDRQAINHLVEELNKVHALIKKAEEAPKYYSSSYSIKCDCNGEYTGLPCKKSCPAYQVSRRS